MNHSESRIPHKLHRKGAWKAVQPQWPASQTKVSPVYVAERRKIELRHGGEHDRVEVKA